MATVKMTNIEEDLAKTLEIKRKKNEGDQAWYSRLVKTGEAYFEGESKDDEWQALPGETQDWYNKAVDALSKNEEIDPPVDADEDADEPEEEEESSEVDEDEESEPDSEDDEDSEDESDDESAEEEEPDTEEEEMTEKKGKGKKAAPKKAAPKKKEAAPKKKVAAKGNGKVAEKSEKKAKSTKPKGAQAFIRGMIIENPKVTTQEMLDALRKNGFQPMTTFTISTTRSSTMQTLRIAKEKGKLRGVAI